MFSEREAGREIKSGVNNKGVCMSRKARPYVRCPQPCLKREAEGSAAVAAARSDAGNLGNVGPLIFF